jgi:hypothetical protein
LYKVEFGTSQLPSAIKDPITVSRSCRGIIVIGECLTTAATTTTPVAGTLRSEICRIVAAIHNPESGAFKEEWKMWGTQ